MSLKYALLAQLAREPQTGYGLAKSFAGSLNYAWPASRSQIYPELARLRESGLIRQTGSGPRSSKSYETTPEGLSELRRWLRETEPDRDRPQRGPTPHLPALAVRAGRSRRLSAPGARAPRARARRSSRESPRRMTRTHRPRRRPRSRSSTACASCAHASTGSTGRWQRWPPGRTRRTLLGREAEGGRPRQPPRFCPTCDPAGQITVESPCRRELSTDSSRLRA